MIGGLVRHGELRIADAIPAALIFGIILPLLIGVLAYFLDRHKKPSRPGESVGRTSALHSRSGLRTKAAQTGTLQMSDRWRVFGIGKKTCGQCGTKIDIEAPRCPFCHNKFSTDEMKLGRTESRETAVKLWSWVALAALLVVSWLL